MTGYAPCLNSNEKKVIQLYCLKALKSVVRQREMKSKTEQDSYLPRDDGNIFLFCFVPLTQEKMVIFTIRISFRQGLPQRHEYEIHAPLRHFTFLSN